MDDRIRKWLMDIQTAIDEINFFLRSLILEQNM